MLKLYDYLPGDPWLRAQVTRWLFFEEDHVQNGVAALRHWLLTGKDARRSEEALNGKRQTALKTLTILDNWLSRHEFLVDCGYTVADMAMYAYVGFADEAGLPMHEYPNVENWIARIRRQPGFLATAHPYSIDPAWANELP